MRIGTRGSALALAQARQVAAALGDEAEIVTITTSGDRDRARQDKERWVKEIEEALLAGEIDVAVHSAKDVPAELPEGLTIVAAPPRADPRDALCGAGSLESLSPGARVGTSSLRRAALLRAAREDLDVVEVRGNVDTRLRKLAGGEYDAIVLALAGLERLGVAERAGAALDAGEFVPAAGQGTLAIEARAGDDRFGALNDAAAMRRLLAERALVRALGADCHTPVGAHAVESGGTLRLSAFVGRADGSAWLRDVHEGSDPEALGTAVGRAAARGGGGRGAGPVSEARVFLVGAGPGDPGLMTARSLELIARADVILHDKLIPAEALDGARPDAEIVDVGKIGGGEQVPAGGDARACCSSTRGEGRIVVRLKGGDPFVFGRGGEEALALRAAGIPFEVVPGITAGVAAPAYAGIPVTQRDVASAVAFVTGHEDPAKPARRRWTGPRSRAFPGTLVFYMGVRQLPRISDHLMAGRPVRRRAGGDRRARDARRPARRASRRSRRCRSGRSPRACGRRRSPSSGRSRRCTRRSAGSRRGRCAAGRSPSRARGRRRRSSAPACAALGARVVEAPAMRIEPLAVDVPDVVDLRPAVRDEPERRRAPARAGARRARARRAADRRHRAGDGARAARGRHRGRRRARPRDRRVAARGARGP